MGIVEIVFRGSKNDCQIYKNFLEDDPCCIYCSELIPDIGKTYRANAELNIPEANI